MTVTGANELPDAGQTTSLPRPLGVWLWLGIGAGSAVVGLLPWIITGMRLPLQNLWDAATLPEQMPIGLLPFSQYAITLIAGILVIGAAIAGVVGRSFRDRLGRHGFATLAAGVFGAQLIAIVQTAVVVGAGLRPGTESTIYLAAVVAVAAASVVVGAVVFVLIARTSRPGALIGLSLAAVAAGWWVDALIAPSAGLVTPLQTTLLGLAQWLPAILCGVAIAWCGIHSVGRIIAALVALTAVVIGPALATAVTAAAGTRVLARYPAEMLDYGAQVFQQVLVTPELTLRPLLTTLVVAAAGLALLAVRRRRSAEA
ncbi:hypothetical protein [Cryobacterium arcticum]|uniref:hypothetical protein n=1 Tax=Cryobacterium arcticum TaxID=670052 RepID=UPI0011B602CA|nr:hypothetical protein [Cryobacterium arcticum]